MRATIWEMDKAYSDKLDGKIDEDFWQRQMTEWRMEEQQATMAIQGLSLARSIFVLAIRVSLLMARLRGLTFENRSARTNHSKLLRLLSVVDAASDVDRAPIAKFPKTPAGSTGRCNTGLKFTRRSLKAQGLSRALIETQGDLVEMGLRVDGQVRLLRKVLS